MRPWTIALAAVTLSAAMILVLVQNSANTAERGAVPARAADGMASQQVQPTEKSPNISKAEFGWGPVRTTDW